MSLSLFRAPACRPGSLLFSFIIVLIALLNVFASLANFCSRSIVGSLSGVLFLATRLCAFCAAPTDPFDVGAMDV